MSNQENNSISPPKLTPSQNGAMGAMLANFDSIPSFDIGKGSEQVTFFLLRDAGQIPIDSDFEPFVKIFTESDVIIQPTTFSIFDADDSSIIVVVLAYLNTPNPDVKAKKTPPLSEGDFDLQYNFSTNSKGFPQLNLYVQYGYTPPTGSAPTYFAYPFIVKIQSNSVELSGIETVNTTLYNTDPNTSRGTTTTVQSSTGGG